MDDAIYVARMALHLTNLNRCFPPRPVASRKTDACILGNTHKYLLGSWVSILLVWFYCGGILAGASAADAKPPFRPIEIKGLEPRPAFWKVRPAEIQELCQKATRGRSEIIARTPGGFPVYAVFYGQFTEGVPQSNWSAGSSSSTWRSYYQREGKEQTVLFCAGIHGAEAESVAAAINLIQMLETGKDFRGKSDPQLLDLARHYRLIIIPCLNLDGRARSPDHLRKTSYEDFRRASQGTWADGSLIGWRGSKEYFPLPLAKVSYPGGYPNDEGFNIMHDASPGHIRTAEARGFLQLVERWNVDLVLNAHSCEYSPSLLDPGAINYPSYLERGRRCVQLVNEALCAAKLRDNVPTAPPKAANTFNLNTMAMLASGALALTLECCVSADYPPQKPCNYTFEEMMEPNFIMLKVLLADGLKNPFADRAALFR